jgi:hypothetical protein
VTSRPPEGHGAERRRENQELGTVAGRCAQGAQQLDPAPAAQTLDQQEMRGVGSAERQDERADADEQHQQRSYVFEHLCAHGPDREVHAGIRVRVGGSQTTGDGRRFGLGEHWRKSWFQSSKEEERTGFPSWRQRVGAQRQPQIRFADHRLGADKSGGKNRRKGEPLRHDADDRVG